MILANNKLDDILNHCLNTKVEEGILICIECQPEFYLKHKKVSWNKKRITTCEPCQKGCYKCIKGTTCSQCNSGYYLSYNKCDMCNEGCEICSDSELCSKCQSKYILVNGLCHYLPKYTELIIFVVGLVLLALFFIIFGFYSLHQKFGSFDKKKSNESLDDPILTDEKKSCEDLLTYEENEKDSIDFKYDDQICCDRRIDEQNLPEEIQRFEEEEDDDEISSPVIKTGEHKPDKNYLSII